MTKQDKIIEEWGNDMPPEGVDSDGFSNHGKWFGSYNRDFYDTKAVGHGFDRIRPIALKGIEHNNGWVKLQLLQIETDWSDCAPFDMWVCDDLEKRLIKKGDYIHTNYTHYQKIEIPKDLLHTD